MILPSIMVTAHVETAMLLVTGTHFERSSTKACPLIGHGFYVFGENSKVSLQIKRLTPKQFNLKCQYSRY
jgi:hypothetical protein